MKILITISLIIFLFSGLYFAIPFLKPNKPDLTNVVGPEGPPSKRLKNIFDGLSKGLN